MVADNLIQWYEAGLLLTWLEPNMLSLCVFIVWSNYVLLPLSHLFAAANKSFSTHGIPCSLPGTVVQGVMKTPLMIHCQKAGNALILCLFGCSRLSLNLNRTSFPLCFSSPLFPPTPTHLLPDIYIPAGIEGKAQIDLRLALCGQPHRKCLCNGFFTSAVKADEDPALSAAGLNTVSTSPSREP